MPIADKDTYTTDTNRSRSILSKLFLSSRFTFYPQAYWIVRRSGRKALRGNYDGSEWAASSCDIMQALENVGVRFEIKGMKNIRGVDGPVVFISNHMSTLETFVLPCIIQPVKSVTFVVKKSLNEMAVFGPVMRSRDPVVVGRTNPREDLRTVLIEGTKKLSSGQSMIIFPQSTRSSTLNPDEFNSLGIKLALKAGVPVVPIAVKTDAWGVGKIRKDFGPIDSRKKVCFAFGEPMNIEARGTEEHQKIISFIKGKLEEWGRENIN